MVRNAELEAECRSHFNEPMLAGFSVVRCIGYGEDEMDAYVIVCERGGEIVWHTMVGGYTWLDRLKGQGHVVSTTGEEWDDLARLDCLLALNGAPRAPEFIVEQEPTDHA